ncbi:hypothetical protein ND486_28305 [Pseudonocardia sp. DR1-2]|uniref:hypothetical protein n=1 Tax=Pseudonocardia sp. DR1-2 TaxID=2951168 RepID=UPI002043C646|nr:hypothetical protein [Pseudonocardia sp. DR1-2]MCM3850101.1 hypothetical protein [Pseudonocardia sp. DR1-2]
MEQVQGLLRRFGAGELGLHDTALALTSAYRDALADDPGQRSGSGDEAPALAWSMVAMARWDGVVTADQAADLVDAVIAWHDSLGDLPR